MIKIDIHNGSVSLERIRDVESEIGVRFPKSYIDFILPNDGCYIEPHGFMYFDESFQKKVGSGIGVFLRLNETEGSDQDILNEYKTPSEFFPSNLIAFAENNGDYICFDYRKGKDNLDPPVVYWSHESEEDKSVSFLADNFEAFLKILKTDEEMDELLK